MTTQSTITRVALVTGASAGIGKAIAESLLDDGWTVFVAARRLEKMAELGDRGAIPIRMDITKDDEIVGAVERIHAETGGVDLLVNNAGFGLYGAVEETPIDDARYQFEVNIFGLARLTQLVIPRMREKGAGRIVNISSIGGRIHTPLGSWYHATKFALEGWSDCLRVELAPFGIDVVVVRPGAIETEFVDVMMAPMIERSGDGPYGPRVQKLAGAVEEMMKQGQGSPPSVIADVITRAAGPRRPKTRYAAGKFAFTLLTLRKILSDRMFDRLITSRF